METKQSYRLEDIPDLLLGGIKINNMPRVHIEVSRFNIDTQWRDTPELSESYFCNGELVKEYLQNSFILRNIGGLEEYKPEVIFNTHLFPVDHKKPWEEKLAESIGINTSKPNTRRNMTLMLGRMRPLLSLRHVSNEKDIRLSIQEYF